MSVSVFGLPARRLVAVIATSAVALGIAAQPATAQPLAESAPSGAGVKSSSTGVYLVQLDDAPVAEYGGGLPGLGATRVAPGGRVQKSAGNVRAYVRHLTAERAAVLDRGGLPEAQKLYDYDYTYAGFAARMSPDEANRLARTAGVKSVEPSELVRADTIDTPRYLGLAGRGGAWEQVGGIDRAGDGVIIGVVDSGYVPERPSFAPIRTSKKSDATIAAKWHGTCQQGVEAPVSCNNKVLGARYFRAGIGTIIEPEFDSPRDLNGHGTHTASTAGGNHGVTMTVQGREWGQGSGIAPHARLAIYKALWHQADGGASGSSADLVAAIDTAVADGVDVINYSISESNLASVTSSIALAFLRAARAGVFVATSAGNTGPGASTVAKAYPWVTTVANGTHDRDVQTTVVLGNGKSFTGQGIGSGTPTAPLVLAVNAALPGADPALATLCAPATLDPAKVTGKIVVCDRGVTDRVDKSLQVRNAGGIGTVLVNPTANSLNGDLHSVPTVHLDHLAAPEVKAYAGTPGATATIQPAVAVRVTGPMVSVSSSRGPTLAASGDLLKPDVMAPGTNVLAATTANSAAGGEYAFLSGTSMASPHVAGLAAVLRSRYPTWSPMAIKSAILTTASSTDTAGQPIKNDSGTPGTPFGYGAGEVKARRSLDPGLVYDSSYTDWTRFACGTGLPSTHALCADGKIDPSDFNSPSIAIGDLAGRQTVRRTVVNVGKHPEVYFPTVEGLAGLQVTVSPRVLVAFPGRPVSYTVTFEHRSAPLEQYAFGKVVWRSYQHTVASTVAVRPLTVKAAAAVTGTGTTGSVPVPLTSGYTGTLNTTVAGLSLPAIGSAALKNPAGTTFPATAPAANDHVAKFTVTVPAGTKLARFATFDADHPAGTDLDVHVYRTGSSARLAVSSGATAQEQIDLVNPSGSYDVYVDLFGGPAQTVSLNTWRIGPAEGNLTANPASQPVTVAGAVTVTAAWTGLEPGKRYLGRFGYDSGGAEAGSTLIRVDT